MEGRKEGRKEIKVKEKRCQGNVMTRLEANKSTKVYSCPDSLRLSSLHLSSLNSSPPTPPLKDCPALKIAFFLFFMEQQNPSTLIETMDKAVKGLRATAAGLEEAAKIIHDIQDPVSLNIQEQFDRIKARIHLIQQADLPKRLEKINELLKLDPAELNERLTKLNYALKNLYGDAVRKLQHVYVASLTLFQGVY